VSESDGKLNAAYRSLAREEPPASLDAAILAASRGALVKPSMSRRWAAPVSIAAVLVLAFGVTLRMQQEQPGVESPDMDSARREAPPAPIGSPGYDIPSTTETQPAEPQAPKAQFQQRAAAPAKKAVMPQAEPVAVPQAKPEIAKPDQAFRDEARLQSERKDMKEEVDVKAKLAKEANVTTLAAGAPPPAAARAFAPEPPASPAAPAAASPAPPAARLKREALAAQAPAGAAAADAQAVDEPTRELEAIARLRVEGRHEEADKALAEFRRKRPDYRIPDAMLERVKPR
jgi:hypothetical protein